jgi:hypothetical protein
LELVPGKIAMIWLARRLNAARWLQDTPLARVYLLTPRPSMPPGHVILAGRGRLGTARSAMPFSPGPHGAMLGELFRMIKNLQHVQPPQLIGFARSIDWAGIDTNTKLVTLHELNAAITRFREKRDPDEPIDDTVEGEPPFRTLKAILFPARAPTGAKPGLSIRNPAA